MVALPIAARSGAARMRGFTMIEVLLAMVLLAAGLALAFAVIRSAQAVGARGEAIAARSERMRAVEGFLRWRLAGALPITFDTEGGARHLRFVGEPERMRFVADLPPYLGHGGPYLHELQTDGRGSQRRLLLDLSMVQAGRVVAGTTVRPPEVLADRLQAVRFRYRGLDPQGGLGDWQAQWPWPERMPLQVEVVIEPDDGEAWPPMVVSLPHGSAGAAP
ncbi:prepilin-type N-terminal cleavage/methylation domain-containing protein [Pseudoxanthomonas suwonensis]|uniref:General secretion pathway protein GspJ n=1 Tax=Pseudoxanthomonas suwonensis TaxID=314722 RepID=A0A0E3UPH9_9GAMM|nr:prepilin-type N-terminal cleavage/methylation domain-containing protein [Pseudoxanthomonas suwonensis]AKC88051.1 general secretion pathway protein GspJ [Pseudoxanthomonas suwonensis]